MILTLDSNRRLRLPAKLVPANPGDKFDVTFDAEEGKLILRRIRIKRSWVEVMKSCPVPMDDLPARERTLPKKMKL